MPFLTLDEARTAFQNARSTRFCDMRKTAGTILREHAERVRAQNHYDVFLSHSSNDADVIGGVKELLEARGLSVYVDWADDSLDRNNVTPEAAAVLRGRMRVSESLIFATSENSSQSKWMRWELGFFDGLKSNRIAIFPVLSFRDQSFQGQEYLGLYPLVQNFDLTGGGTDLGIDTGPRRIGRSRTLHVWAYFSLNRGGSPKTAILWVTCCRSRAGFSEAIRAI